MEKQSLRESLHDWQDWDYAAFLLARSLGLMGADTVFATDAKHVFWTKTPVGEALHTMLNELVQAGVLEFREERWDQYRWNSDFICSWERRAK